jgi:hypothetical protein
MYCKLAAPRQRPSAPRPRGRRILAADGCASSSSDQACCLCTVWVPGEPREWRSPCSDTGLYMLICRIEGAAPGRIYAQECIIFHDSGQHAYVAATIAAQPFT